MANDMFGGLGSLMKGLSGFMPKDDPGTKLFTAQNELGDLQSQQNETYAEIGRKAVEDGTASRWPELLSKLKLIETNIAATEEKLNQAKAVAEADKQAAAEAQSKCTCPECGHINADGVKFCQECGAKIGSAAKCFCTECGEENAPGTKFCGSCGAKISG